MQVADVQTLYHISRRTACSWPPSLPTGCMPCLQAQHTTAAHSAGLIAMDAKADLLATAGYGTRQGRVVAEMHVKVGGWVDATASLPVGGRRPTS
jgi:hypothetical protein